MPDKLKRLILFSISAILILPVLTIFGFLTFLNLETSDQIAWTFLYFYGAGIVILFITAYYSLVLTPIGFVKQKLTGSALLELGLITLASAVIIYLSLGWFYSGIH